MSPHTHSPSRETTEATPQTLAEIAGGFDRTPFVPLGPAPFERPLINGIRVRLHLANQFHV